MKVFFNVDGALIDVWHATCGSGLLCASLKNSFAGLYSSLKNEGQKGEKEGS
jgi:hypothetical protein